MSLSVNNAAASFVFIVFEQLTDNWSVDLYQTCVCFVFSLENTVVSCCVFECWELVILLLCWISLNKFLCALFIWRQQEYSERRRAVGFNDTTLPQGLGYSIQSLLTPSSTSPLIINQHGDWEQHSLLREMFSCTWRVQSAAEIVLSLS